MEGERVKSLITRMMVFQLTLILLIGLALLLFFDAKLAFAGLVGGLIWLLPNYHMACGLLNLQRGLEPEDRLRKIYLKSAFKIIYSLALFLIAIIFFRVNFSVVVTVYLTLALVSGFAFRYSENAAMREN
jgi:F0F1-type ATP synthase assembly protein I